ncbi:MAG: pyridoxal-phosphate dependent enzyme [Actinomycetota bacterium]|nr:pyridoxal-phosphate dependent enzyme [Actinomycetota bacterium]
MRKARLAARSGALPQPASRVQGTTRYATVFAEIDAAGAGGGHPGPAAVAVPVGVGALDAALAGYRASGGVVAQLVGVEPTETAWLAVSVRAGEPVTRPGPDRSVMVGPDCATLSLVAWPAVSQGTFSIVVVGDVSALDAVADLAAAGVKAGETGAKLRPR